MHELPYESGSTSSLKMMFPILSLSGQASLRDLEQAVKTLKLPLISGKKSERRLLPQSDIYLLCLCMFLQILQPTACCSLPSHGAFGLYTLHPSYLKAGF